MIKDLAKNQELLYAENLIICCVEVQFVNGNKICIIINSNNTVDGAYNRHIT